MFLFLVVDVKSGSVCSVLDVCDCDRARRPSTSRFRPATPEGSADRNRSVRTAAPMAREGAGATGFLFGNIDARGRLDEDYLDDDAKDAIDNVAPEVAKEGDLRDIAQALPGEGGEDRDDDEAPASAATVPEAPDPNRKDYYDEDEYMDDGLDDTERERMARVALAGAGKVKAADDDDYDDDDNYDEDEDNAAAPTAPLPLAASSAPVPAKAAVVAPASVSLAPVKLSAPTVPIATAAASTTSPSRQQVPASGEPVIADGALELQRRLMREAKSVPTPMAVDVAVDVTTPPAAADALPVRFSTVFTEPVRKMRMIPKRKRFGIVPAEALPVPDFAPDDTELLDTPAELPKVDPVRLFLAQDEQNASSLAPTPATGAPPIVPTVDTLSPADLEEYAQAAAPLDEQKSPLRAEDATDRDTEHVLVQQISWEDNIQWGPQGDVDDDEDDDFYKEDRDETADSGGSGAAGREDDKDIDENDDDDDEFEEPVMMKDIGKANGAPAIAPTAAPESDSDDDMVWEDGNGGSVSSKQPEQQTVSNVAVNSSEVSAKPSAKPVQLSSSPGFTKHTDVPQSSSQQAPVVPLSKPRPDIAVAEEDAKKKSVSFAHEKSSSDIPNGDTESAVAANESVVLRAMRKSIPSNHPGCEIVRTVIAPNKDLEAGTWIEGVVWDSLSEAESGTTQAERRPQQTAGALHHGDIRSRFSKLILDMNDPNMIFEQLSDDTVDTGREHGADGKEGAGDGDSKRGHGALLVGTPTGLGPRTLDTDPFNISNDMYYASGGIGSNLLKVDRRSLMRGLHNAPPAVKCQTTKSVPSEEALLWFHRPKLDKNHLPRGQELIPFRRKRPKGGTAQIAGQIPKKKNELLCSAKDVYRVSLFEYALEKQPCVLPIPGMASRIVTYARKSSAAAAAQALKNAAGTPEADTVFLSPDEPPPVHAGDLEADGKPLSVIESHSYTAPCVRNAPPSSDFLVVRRGGKMYVREIDSVASLGVTEPKIEIMAPNTDRFKKYAKDRVLLWILREFTKQAKKSGIDGGMAQASLDKEQIFEEFTRRRTFPETSLLKMLKELARYQNGRYIINEEPSKSVTAREAELLRTVTPLETAAFEAMEAGWESLIQMGIRIFTHPTTQGNIIAAAERTGLKAGPSVGLFVKNQLLKSPWYRSQIIIASQKQQRKEMLQALANARIVNDLREGGSVMETRLVSLSSAEMHNVLVNQYKVVSKKVPADLEKRREMVRDLALKKSKGSEAVDYATVITNVLHKHRSAGQGRTGAGSGVTAAVAAGGAMVIPLEVQRRALEEGDVSDLPAEEERATAGETIDAAVALAATGDDAFGKLRSTVPGKESKSGVLKSAPKKGKGAKRQRPPTSGPRTQKDIDVEEDAAELDKLLSSSVVAGGGAESNGAGVKPPSGEGKKKHGQKKKKIARLKVTKKVTDADGTRRDVVTYVTDPVEIERILSKGKGSRKKLSPPGADSVEGGGSASAGASKLKIAINVHKLSQGGKAGVKKKQGPGPSERKKLAASKSGKKGGGRGDGAGAPGAGASSSTARKVGGDKGQIGKIKISTKQIKREKEQAALKRKRSQYSDDLDYPSRKTAKTGTTSRRKRNGRVQLNGILAKIEQVVRQTEGYVEAHVPVLKIARLRDGESPPHGTVPSNLAKPANTGLDFTVAVDAKSVPHYKEVVKKPMFLNLIRSKCSINMSYQSSKEFLDDMRLMVDNARAFNTGPDVQWVVQHAELLCEVAEEQVSLRAEEIAAAEEMVIKEKAEARNASKGGRSLKSKSRRGSGSSVTPSKTGPATNGKSAQDPADPPRSKDTPGRGGDVEDATTVVNAVTPLPMTPGLDGSLPAASPPPVIDAGMTDDIYEMDGPLLEPSTMLGGLDGEEGGAELALNMGGHGLGDV